MVDQEEVKDKVRESAFAIQGIVMLLKDEDLEKIATRLKKVEENIAWFSEKLGEQNE